MVLEPSSADNMIKSSSRSKEKTKKVVKEKKRKKKLKPSNLMMKLKSRFPPKTLLNLIDFHTSLEPSKWNAKSSPLEDSNLPPLTNLDTTIPSEVFPSAIPSTLLTTNISETPNPKKKKPSY